MESCSKPCYNPNYRINSLYALGGAKFMNIDEAIKERHMVRVYKKQSIPADVCKQLNERIKALNEGLDVFMSLVTNDSSALNTAVKIGFTKNVNNYIVLSGKNESDLEEKLGYGGADLMLFAQTLGLNTWWVSEQFNKGKARDNGGIPGSNLIKGIIVIGYGENNGVPHKSKSTFDVSKFDGATPPFWFIRGVGSALLAPTANNRQAFKIEGHDNKVTITCSKGRYSGLELGIIKYFFEVGAGRENFIYE